MSDKERKIKYYISISKAIRNTVNDFDNGDVKNGLKTLMYDSYFLGPETLEVFNTQEYLLKVFEAIFLNNDIDKAIVILKYCSFMINHERTKIERSF